MNTKRMTTMMAVAFLALAACAFIAPIQDADAAGLVTDPYMYEGSLILELDEQVDPGIYFATINPAVGEPISVDTNAPVKIDVLAFVVDLVDGNYTIDVTNNQGSPVVSGTFTVGTGVTPTTYTVTWMVDGVVYATGDYESGEELVIPDDPVKGATTKFTYTFAGWDVEPVTPVTADATYTATFTETPVDPPVEPPVVPPVEDEPVEPTEIVYLTGILESEFIGKPTQIVVIDDDLTVKADGEITIEGKLIVEAGYEVVFEYGSWIEFKSGSTAEIKGDVVIEAKGDSTATLEEDAIFTFSGKEMTIDGEFVLEGAKAFKCTDGDVTINGTLVVEDEATAAFPNPVEVSSTGTMNVYGLVSGDIVVAGLVDISYEGAQGALALHIDILDGGEVIITNAYGTVTVCDERMTYTEKKVEKPIPGTNAITLVNVSGATITEKMFDGKDENGDRLVTKTMYLDGEATVATKYVDDDEKVAGAITLTGDSNNGIAIDTDFVLEVPMKIVGNVTVNGTVSALEKDYKINVNGDLNVPGTITIAEEITGADINAAKYQTEDREYFIYTTVEKAVAAGAKDITLTGDVIISEDLVITPDMKVDAVDANSVTITDAATVTVEYDEEARKSGKFITPFKADAMVDVEGTLVVENLNKSKVVDSKVLSDTSKVDGDGKTYTNLYDALDPENVTEGDVVKITRLGDLRIEKDLVIPAGVTLEVPKDYAHTVIVCYDVTVTVEGTLKALGNYTMETDDPNEKKADAETIVEGIMFFDDGNNEYANTYPGLIVGAYFTYQKMDAIAPLATAADLVNDIESEDITLYGEMTVGDIEFVIAEDSKSKVERLVSTDDLTAGTITLGGIAFVTVLPEAPVAEEDEEVDYPIVNATIAMVNGSIVLDNVYGLMTIQDRSDDSGEETVQIAEARLQIVSTAPEMKASTFEEGTITVNGKVSVYAVTMPSVTLVVPAGAEMTTITGEDDATSIFIGAVIVEGSLVASADAGFTLLNVTGTTASAEVEEGKKAQTVTAQFLVVGAMPEVITEMFAEGYDIALKDLFDDMYGTIAADASATGVELTTDGVAYVAPGSTVGKEISDLESTVYMTEKDIEYLTVYVGATSKMFIKDMTYEVESAVFDGWFYTDKDGKLVEVQTTDAIGKYETVKAQVITDIYEVVIYTDGGIKGVAIDGINLINDQTNIFSTYYYLEAGKHTITYEHKDGYKGTAVLYVDKQAQSGLDFTLAGTDGLEYIGADKIPVVTVEFTLAGTVVDDEKIVVDVNGEKGDGMSLTEILLIVLVVLILIMAIIVAMRLMRS